MGIIVNAYIFAHPPLIIPEIGQGREADIQRTVDAFKKAACDIKNDKPDTIVLITPHGPFFRDLIFINDAERPLRGDMRRYGAPDVKLEFQNNLPLVQKIIRNAFQNGIRATGAKNDLVRRILGSYVELDHGAIVPLYYISKEIRDFKLVHMGVADLPYSDLFKFGQCVAEAIEDVNGDEACERAVIVASGDMSHSLTWDAPCGYNEKGHVFDKMLVEYISRGDIESIVNFDRELAEEAAECGLRSFIMMLGALRSYNIHPEVYSYEGPFGVGYMVAKIGLELKREVK